MNYAIEELNKQGRNCKVSKILKNYSDECFRVAKALENNEFIETSTEVKEHLLEVYNLVCLGLENWGNSYEEARQRQEKKKRELKEAIELLKIGIISTQSFNDECELYIDTHTDEWVFKYKGVIKKKSKSKFECLIVKKALQKELGL